MPKADFLTSLIDTLSKRYGWSTKNILEDMYWEEVYEMYEYASNLEVIERNEDMRFNYLLHAQTAKALNNWRDLPIPFPDRNWIPPKKADKVPIVFDKFKTKGSKMSAEKRAEVQKMIARIKETRRKAREAQFGSYYDN